MFGDFLMRRFLVVGALVLLAVYGFLAFVDSGLRITQSDFVAANFGVAETEATDLGGKQEVLRWGLLDKRWLIYGYSLLGLFAAWYAFVGRTATLGPATRLPITPSASVVNAVVITLLAFALVGVPALSTVGQAPTAAFESLHDMHNYMHLGGFEQIRQGASPYLGAQTQYGIGTQVLMYQLTSWLSFSIHGFYAASVLLNVICIIVFLLIIERTLGLRWALAALLGFVLWPSPASVTGSTPGWALATRWVFIATLALLIPRALLAGWTSRGKIVAGSLLGALWGAGAFLSQETLSGGALVMVLCLLLFASLGRLTLVDVIKFASTFVVAGIVCLLALVATVVGPARAVEALRLANEKASLVAAGVSNSWWSFPIDLAIGLRTLNGRLYWGEPSGHFEGDLTGFFLTYGGALLLLAAMAVLARFLARDWDTAGTGSRSFAVKFGSVAVGAFTLQVFMLLRADYMHVAGPSFLLPVFLLSLPLFLWHCLRSVHHREAFTIGSAAVVAVAVAAGLPSLGRHIGQVADLGGELRKAIGIYAELRAAPRPADLASRYSPIARYQEPLRRAKGFDEARELFALLHEKRQGKPVELGFYKVNDLVAAPEIFYFLGGFRTVSPVTSPMVSIWLRSEEQRWLRTVTEATNACVFLSPDAKGGLVAALRQRSSTEVRIEGERFYGVLSCR